MTDSITTSTGTTVSVEEHDGEKVVILTNPDAPEDLRRSEAGRLVIGGYQAPLFMPYALSPETLRAIAELAETTI